MMRVSMFEMYSLSSRYSSKLQNVMAEQSLQISTGKQFIYPSENPTKMNQSLLLQSSEQRIGQLQKNAEDAISFLERTESVLGSAVDVIQQTREQGLLAISGQHNDANKETFAKVIDDNIKQLLSLANTKHLNRYIFSGEKTQTVPFSYDGTTSVYNGDTNNITFKVGDANEVAISETGDVVFEEVINAMILLRDTIRAGNETDVQNAIDQLDKGFDQLIDTRSDIGVRTKGLKLMVDTYENTTVDLKAKRSVIEDTDVTEVYSEFMKNSMLFQGTVQASLKMFESSILNYI